MKERLELISEYSNNSFVRNLSNEERLYLYEAKDVFDLHLTSSNNPNQKGRNDQKYCNSLFENTGKTCKEIGALNKQKEKVQNSPILI